MIKISVLMENTACSPDFQSEHGLSLWIETAHHTILFDTGKSGAFAANAAALGINLSEADIAVLSHGHYDHGGGLKTFLSLNEKAPVYLTRLAFVPHYSGTGEYIGLDPSLKGNPRLVTAADPQTIDDELMLCTCNERTRFFPTDTAGLTEKPADTLQPDAFLHEQYLTIRDGGRKIVVSGCSHKGIRNIVRWLRPDILIGGFHFMKMDVSSGENPLLKESAEDLLKFPTDYYTCHCTGIAQYRYLKSIMGNRIHYLSAGMQLEI